MGNGGPDPRNQPPGRGVAVTDWRLYTADHRHIDGGEKQIAHEKPRRGRGFSDRDMPHNAEGGPDPRNCSRAGGDSVT